VTLAASISEYVANVQTPFNAMLAQQLDVMREWESALQHQVMEPDSELAELADTYREVERAAVETARLAREARVIVQRARLDATRRISKE
jgi:hypothetical protein